MALELFKSETSKIERTTVKVLSIINLPEDKCPKAKDGNPIPKSLLITSNGVVGVLDNQIKNLPVSFPEAGLDCNLSFENVTVGDKSYSNIKQAEFQSTLRFIVANAKAVVAPEH
jgi:hypothetical protein